MHAPYCHLWSVPLYNIFPHYLLQGMILEKVSLNTKIFLIFFTACVWNISHSQKKWATYDARYIRLETYTENMWHWLLFHYNNCCKNVPQYHVIRTLPVLFPAAAHSYVYTLLHVSATHGATLLKKTQAVYRLLKRYLCLYNAVATGWVAETFSGVENRCLQ
jgi:hypothetical protein